MEEYIKMLLEQVRFQKAHKAIGDEIRSHIEDQVQANISEGMDEVTAEKKAVEDMGDPVDVGIELDKVHRPKMAWGVVIVALVIAVIGTLVQVLVVNDPLIKTRYGNIPFWAALYGCDPSLPVYIVFTVLGSIAMLLMYLIDYTTVAKYSKVIAISLISLFFVTNYYNNMLLISSYEGSMNGKPLLGMLVLTDWILFFINSLMLLIIPLYAGILYKYKGQKYVALVKAVLWIVISCGLMCRCWEKTSGVIFMIAMLVELTIAIKKGWIKVHKIPAITVVWSSFVLFIGKFIFDQRKLLGDKILNLSEGNGESYQISTVNANVEILRRYLGAVRLFGNGLKRSVGEGMSAPVSFSINDPGSSMVLPYVLTTYGIVAGLVIIVAVASVVVYGFVTMAKTKNQLGIVMGSGCMMWLIVNLLANIFVGLGMFPQFETTFFPFISNKYLIVSYMMFGILLSIYKYKNAYSEHVDISLRANLKKTK